jgi:hypothetical protein
MVKGYYHISYTGGGGGKFIACILHCMLNDPEKILKFTGYNAHDEHDYKFKTIDHHQTYLKPRPWRIITEEFKGNVPWPYLVFPHGPITAQEHYDDLETLYPDWQELAITVDDCSLQQVCINHLHKAHTPTQPMRTISHMNHRLWQAHRDTLSARHKSRIHSIEYSQICDDPAVVIKLLCDITRRNMTDRMKLNYMDYVFKQLEFRNLYQTPLIGRVG